MLRYAAFGAASAAGVSALYGAHTDLVLGFGLGAAGAYGGASLFASEDNVGTYLAADRALACISGQAEEAISVVKPIRSTAQEYESVPDTLNGELVKLKSMSDGLPFYVEVAPIALAALNAFEAARRSIPQFKALDGEFASVTRKSRDTVLGALNQRTSNNRASLEAIMQVARGIGLSGAAYGSSGGTSGVAADAGGEQGSVIPKSFFETASPKELAASIRALSTDLQQAADSIKQKVGQATNAMAELAAICVLDLPPVPALTTTQSTLVLGNDQTAVIVTQGGKLPLSTSWVGVSPASDEFDVIATAGHEIVVSRKKVSNDKSYTLYVKDAMAAAHSVSITIAPPAATN